MEKWWDKSDQNLTYCKYQVGQTEVLIGPRLDLSSRGCSRSFFESVNAWISVTESYVEYPIDSNVRWFPWKEQTESLPDHVLYGSMKMLNYWINELKLKRIYLHCDLGTHRAPTVFGAFLKGYFPKEAKTIEKNREIFNKECSTIIGSNGTEHGQPNIYIASYLGELPLLETMINTIVQYPHLNLNDVCKQSFTNRPLSLYTVEEKEEYDQNERENDYQKRMKVWLQEKGFNLSKADNSHTLYDILDDQGNGTHIVSDVFRFDIFKSLTKYGQVYFTHNKLKIDDSDFDDENLVEVSVETNGDLILVKWKKG